MKYAFAGNRRIAYNILKFIINEGYKPSALLLVDSSDISSSMRDLVELDESNIFIGKDSINLEMVHSLQMLDLDYIIGIHYPFIIPKEILTTPKIGFINLHPAYLPYNRGWHTPSWAILNGTKYGATLHFMSDRVDEGDIILQKDIDIMPSDTADELYARVLKLEEEVFISAFPMLVSLKPPRIKQNLKEGDSHTKKDLEKRQEVKLSDSVTYEESINQFRALTTNNIDEATYFRLGDKKYAIQIIIKEI